MNYPLLSDYCSAVKQAADNFDQLQHLSPVLDDRGEPVMSSGNFAVVFRMHDARAGKDVAVKCFLKEQEGRAESYRLISQELSFVSGNFLTPIRYLEKELFVASNSTADEEFPVVLMDWIEGVTLDRYVVTHLQDAYALKLLAFQFSRLASWLMSQPFAHGDLKPDNILVRQDGSLVLVDYDGMYVPAMQGQQARELGSPDFRHPLRTAERFDDHIDDFALAVILLSLKALSVRPSLWNEYAAADRLLFSAADYRDLSACALLKVLPELFTDAELTRIYGLFLLAHANRELSAVSFRLMNLSFPEKSQKKEQVELSTKVTDEDRAEGILDAQGVLYSKDGLRLLKGNGDLTTYSVREGTRVICDEAFRYCKSLKSLTLPSSLTSIGANPFCGCDNLTLYNNSSHFKIMDNMLLSSDGTYLISYLGKEIEVTIPAGVRSIGRSAFWRCKSLRSLTLPSSLTSIGDSAFSGCESLTSLTLPSGLTSIGNSAFLGCESLRNLTFPSGLTSIGNRAFGGCRSLTHLTFSLGLTSIGNRAFDHCKSLRSLTFPSSLTSIGRRAFWDCKSLRSLTLPSGLTSIGANPFLRCGNLTLYNNSSHFKIIDHMLLSSDGTHLIAYLGNESEVTIPAGVRSIGDSAFSGCESLRSLTFPSGLTSIGDRAFQDCESLRSLTFPSGLTSIGDWAFSGCESLASLILPSGLASIGDWVFSGCESLASLILPSGLTSIGDRAFSGCESLASLILPSGLMSIGNSAFLGCRSLECLTFPSGLTSIGANPFSECKNLTLYNNSSHFKIMDNMLLSSDGTHLISYLGNESEVTIPVGVRSIGDRAFWGCESLASLTLPSSLTSIGDWAFLGCKSLRSLTFPSGLTSIGDWAFEDCYSLTIINIPQGTESHFKQLLSSEYHSKLQIQSNTNLSSPEKSQKKEQVELSTKVTAEDRAEGILDAQGVLYSKDGLRLLKGNWKLKTYSVREGTRVICDEAFCFCSFLIGLTFPSSLKSIGNRSFEHCSSLIGLTFPSSLKSIGNRSFEYCSSLTSLTFPSNLTSIGDSAFEHCSSLTNLVLPSNLSSIGNDAFFCCRSLTTINIPQGTESYFKQLLSSEYHSMLRTQSNS